MAADIDEFIRNQKIRMARDRQKISANDEEISQALPVRPQDQVGAILREMITDEPHPQDEGMTGPTNEERKAAIDGRYGGSAMPGIGERAGQETRQVLTDRNRDYNAFKAAEEAKFRNRFAQRKVLAAPGQPIMAPQPGMVPPQMPPPRLLAPQAPMPPQPVHGPQYPSPPAPPRRIRRQMPQEAAPNFGPNAPPAVAPVSNDDRYSRKLDSLEQTVAELQKQMTRQGQRQQPPPPEEPRQGWATPDYADLLAAKRRQEAQRRRLEDPELFGRLESMQSDKERRLEELEFEMNAQKANLITSRRSGPRRLPLDLDNSEEWLRSEANPDLDEGLKRLEAPRQGPKKGNQTRRGDVSNREVSRASLGVGLEERPSAKVRRQGAYREQLQQQMREQEEKKKRERAERLAPPSEAPLTRRGPSSQIPVMAQASLASAQPIAMQTGLENLPSLTAYNTPADDAYFFYASRDPLDVGDAEDAVGPSTAVALRQLEPPPGQNTQRRPPDQAANTAATNRMRMQGSTLGQASGDVKEAERRRKAAYAQELQKQMQEVAAQKERKRKEQEEYDRKKDEEIANYNMFQRGGGGGGEPIKMNGQAVTDLRAHKRQGGATPRASQPPPASAVGASGEFKLQLFDSIGSGQGGLRGPGSEAGTQRTPRQVNSLGEATHARGGHGVFGQPKTDEEKEKIDRYKDELRLQIEENKRKKEEQRQKEKLQEEKEQKRTEDQMKRIQAEFEEEQRKKQEKIEATKQKNEEMWREAEEKRKRAAEDRKSKVTAPAQASARGPERPPPSPPIPTLKRQQRMQSPRVQPTSQPPTSSRPPPAQPGTSRPESQPDVLRHLERMKQELQVEKLKRLPERNKLMEDALRGRFEEIPTSAKGGRRSRTSILDPFELARQGRSGPVVVRSQRQVGEEPNQEVLRDFRNLRLRDSEVGRTVRAEHPGTPLTSDQLEIQQNTYLRQQQKVMHDMTHKPIEPVRYASPRSPTPRQPVPLPRSQRPPERDLEIASTNSFDVEDLNHRTEERMRRLSRMNADQISMQDQDEVLDRFMRQRTHITNEAEREEQRPPSVRNRQTSYDAIPQPSKQTSMPAPTLVNRDTSYRAPSVPGVPNINSHDGWDDESPTPGGPTPLDDTWLNPTRRR